jgi:hypothetical protein
MSALGLGCVETVSDFAQELGDRHIGVLAVRFPVFADFRLSSAVVSEKMASSECVPSGIFNEFSSWALRGSQRGVNKGRQEERGSGELLSRFWDVQRGSQGCLRT